MFDPVCASL